MATGQAEYQVNFPTLYITVDWIEQHCVIPDGFRRGDAMELYPWQAWCTLNHYRVREDAEWIPENPLRSTAFVYRISEIIAPQKSGKGPWSAAGVALEGAGPALFAGWAGKDDGYACSDWGCDCGWEYAYAPGEPMGMRWPTPLIQVTAFAQDQRKGVLDRCLRAGLSRLAVDRPRSPSRCSRRLRDRHDDWNPPGSVGWSDAAHGYGIALRHGIPVHKANPRTQGHALPQFEPRHGSAERCTGSSTIVAMAQAG